MGKTCWTHAARVNGSRSSFSTVADWIGAAQPMFHHRPSELFIVNFFLVFMFFLVDHHRCCLMTNNVYFSGEGVIVCYIMIIVGLKLSTATP